MNKGEADTYVSVSTLSIHGLHSPIKDEDQLNEVFKKSQLFAINSSQRRTQIRDERREDAIPSKWSLSSTMGSHSHQ
jgi:hypothetical protein